MNVHQTLALMAAHAAIICADTSASVLIVGAGKTVTQVQLKLTALEQFI